ncbi:MAG: PDZ domain-containing protein [Arcobacteraceae bacterium]|nr:PDZ domain-containing protein [Arcobacteraceae bacterium]
MKATFNFLNRKFLIYMLVYALSIKILWLIAMLFWLDKEDVNDNQHNNNDMLYYSIKLQNSSNAAMQSISNLKLLGLYNSDNILVATIENAGKTEVLSRGEELNGYKLTNGGLDWIELTKGSEKFKIMIENISNIQSSISTANSNVQPNIGPSVNINENFNQTTSTQQSMEMGTQERKNGTQLKELLVTSVEQGSLFEKIGLMQNDLIVAINGQMISSFKSAIEVYQQLSIDKNIKIKIIRDTKEKELIYEIN